MPGSIRAALVSTPDSGTSGIRTDVIGRPSGFPGWWRSISPVDLAITLAFVLILIVQISRHDMWRDEIHSWGLVLASPTLPELFGNLRYTGHPGLWYVILWLASWVSASPYTIQVVHATIAIGLIGMIGLVSPFSRLERVLLLASYFVLFEYTVVSRNYGIGFLIALVYADMRARRPDALYINAILLGLLANTNMFAFVLSGALAVEYLVDLIIRRHHRGVAAFAKDVLPAALLYAAFALGAVATMWPSPDISWRTTGEPLSQVLNLDWFLTTLAGNLAAIVPTHPLNYWDASSSGTVNHAEVVLLPLLGVMYFQIFRRHRRLLIILGLTALGSIAICQFVYGNSIRHWGVNFVALIAALWMLRVWQPQRSWLVVALLAINALAGVAVSIQQFPATFSEGRHTADWLRQNGLADAALVGTPDTLVVVVAQYLGRPIYQLDCSCTDTYLFYSRRRDAYRSSQIPERMALAVKELDGRPIVFLVSRPLRDGEQSALRDRGIAATQIAAFNRSMIDEDFYVYRIDRVRGGAERE